jgi:RNA polymerase sigma factor (sigma-70 family)
MTPIMPNHKRNHPSGKLKGVDLKRVRNLLDQYDFRLPGHCLYTSPQKTRPDILKSKPLPTVCNRVESEAAIHFYNHKKRMIYEAIMDGNSYKSISARIRVANEIRWEIVVINMGIIYSSIKNRTNLEEFIEPMVHHMHQTVDRFNPGLGYAPSTYFRTACKHHIWKCVNGNANQRNMNYVFASDMGIECSDRDFQSTFDSKTVDPDANTVEEEVEHLENVERIAVLMDSLDEDRDRELIKMRFFSEMTLQEIADVLQLSRERIRQLERRALNKMSSTANLAQYRLKPLKLHP